MNISLLSCGFSLGAVGAGAYLCLKRESSKTQKIAAATLMVGCLSGAFLTSRSVVRTSTPITLENLGSVWKEGDFLLVGIEGSDLVLLKLRTIVRCTKGPNGTFQMVREVVKERHTFLVEGSLPKGLLPGDILRPIRSAFLEHLQSGERFPVIAKWVTYST